MLKIQSINSSNINANNQNVKFATKAKPAKYNEAFADLKCPSSANLQAYHPSFSKKQNKTIESQVKEIASLLDNDSKTKLKELNKKGILSNNDSNDGSTVLENLYKIATEPRIQGLDKSVILKEVIKALDNPYSITQKFGDIPEQAVQEIKEQTGEEVPESAKHIASSSCVVASMEYNLASKNPAEFVRFAEGLSSENYSVSKKIKMSDITDNTASGLWLLREFNTDRQISNWDDVNINIKPDRNAIVRARMQTTYKDPNERSCVDVLIQSALLNLGSQHTYDSITDERTGKFNNDKSGLTDFEKNFVEEVVFATPKISVVYQDIDENGKLAGYNCEPSETKQHILKSLDLGHNVIIGYTHLDSENKVDGGHEITIIDYQQDENGSGFFICNDTDDNLDEPIKIEEDKLLKLIHHAGIPKEALSEQDVVVEPWREILDEFQNMLKSAA